MRPQVFQFSAPSVNSICATQTTTATGQSLQINGSLRDYAALDYQVQQAWVGGIVPPNVIGAGIQRTITVTSTGNISTSTMTIVGYDTSGTLLSTSITGPNNSTASTTTEFMQVIQVSVGTIATTAFTVGTGAIGSTRWVQTDTFKTPFAVTVAANIVATTVVATVQDTPGDPNSASFATTMIFNHPTLSSISVSAESNYAYPARFIRSIVNGMTASSSYTFTAVQAG
jgi:hypothetical protein